MHLPLSALLGLLALTEAGPIANSSDLVARQKSGRPILPYVCADGAKFSKTKVYEALKAVEHIQIKQKKSGGYPHLFGNKSGNSPVFPKVTKELATWPIVKDDLPPYRGYG